MRPSSCGFARPAVRRRPRGWHVGRLRRCDEPARVKQIDVAVREEGEERSVIQQVDHHRCSARVWYAIDLDWSAGQHEWRDQGTVIKQGALRTVELLA